MRISLRNFIVVFLVAMFFSFCVQAEKKKLIVGTSAEYVPFTFVQKGKLVGFDIDLINLITKRLGYEIEIKDIEFTNLFDKLQNKETDIIISAITATKERMKKFHFSGRYYFPRYAILHRKNSDVHSVNELRDKNVAVLSGSAMETFLVKQLSLGIRMNIIKYKASNFMIQDLKDKKIDAVLVENVQAKFVQEKNDKLSYFLITDANQGGYAIVFPRNSTLVDEFNEELVELKVSGQLDALKVKWGL